MGIRPALLGCAVGLAAPAAHADKADKKAPADVVSIDAVKEKLVVLRTDGGHYVVIEPFNISSDHFYFGDDKNLYRQRTWSGSQEGDVRFSRNFWAPRVDHRSEVGYKDGLWYLECGQRTTPLAEVTGVDAGKLLDKAVYHSPLWKREGYHLSRDDRGIYYYVDRLRDEHGGKGFRLFIGAKGKLKLTKLTNIVSDSEGDIFSTRKGDLRFIMNRGEPENATWVERKKKLPLTIVPMHKNIVLIYDELGMYEGQDLGTACDYY
jgi:hypothetical protein